MQIGKALGDTYRIVGNMSNRMRKFLPLFNRISKLGNKEKSQYAKRNKEFLDCISECAKNILRGNVQLSANQKTALCRNRQNLRCLSIKKTSLKKKRQIIQKGGFLGAILAPVLATLGGGVLSSLFGNRN